MASRVRWGATSRTSANFPRRDWEASLNWLNLSGIALTLWDRLQKLGAEDAVPRQVGAALAANLADHRKRVEVMIQEFDSLNREFERAGVEYVVFGRALLSFPTIAGTSTCGRSYDYDYLVPVPMRHRARKGLQSIGYVLQPEPDQQLHLTFVPCHSSYALRLCRSASILRAFPARWDCIWVLGRKTYSYLLSIARSPLGPQGRRSLARPELLYSLGEYDAFVFQALHTTRAHAYQTGAVSAGCTEIAFFVANRSTDSPFWEGLYAHLDGNEPLLEVVALVVSLATRLFHVPLPASIGRRIHSAMPGPVALWVDRYGVNTALGNFSEDKYSLFLYREFVRDKTVWRKIRTTRLLPLHLPPSVPQAVMPAGFAPFPQSWRRAWYVVERLIDHLASGAGYAWESVRWGRLRHLGINKTSLSVSGSTPQPASSHRAQR